MYEFTNKEIRIRFKETEFGKKLNKRLLISAVISGGLFLISFIMFFFMTVGEESLTIKENIILNILFAITIISIIISCYFDGKRDGAIKQYILNIKKKK